MLEKVELTIEQLEEIKQTSFNNGISSNQGHNQSSKETLQMFASLKELFSLEFKSIRDVMSEHDKKNDRDNHSIIEQTTKTNGRVTKLETETIPKLLKDDIQPLKDWRNGLLGAWAVLSMIVLGIVIPLALNYFKSMDKTYLLAKQISDISATLNKAEITTTK